MDSSAPLLQYNIFKPHRNLLAFTTTKQTLNINRVRFSNSQENKSKLAQKLGLHYENMVYPSQTHTSCVVDLTENPKHAIHETDALVTNTLGLCLCVQTADCVPILLFDPVQKVVSAVHAGWRGTVGKIVEEAVLRMQKNYRSNPDNILAAIGPSISPEIYEVGNEVVQAAKKSIPNATHTLHKNGSGKYHFNLWEANKQLLLRNGLNPENIEILSECSFQKEEKYYSARREGMDTGRMVSGIMLKLQ